MGRSSNQCFRLNLLNPCSPNSPRQHQTYLIICISSVSAVFFINTDFMARGKQTLIQQFFAWHYSDPLHTHCCTSKGRTCCCCCRSLIWGRRELSEGDCQEAGLPQARRHPSTHWCCCLSVTKGGDSCVTCSARVKWQDENRGLLHEQWQTFNPNSVAIKNNSKTVCCHSG